MSVVGKLNIEIDQNLPEYRNEADLIFEEYDDEYTSPFKKRTLIDTIKATITDPRNAKGQIYSFSHLVVVVAVAITQGYTDCEDIHTFCEENWWLFSELFFSEAPPSSSTFRRIIAGIDKDQLEECLSIWIKSFRTLVPYRTKDGKIIISPDGKALRAATKKSEGEFTRYIINAFIAGIGIDLKVHKIEKKSNEQKEFPDFIEKYPDGKVIITGDAAATTENMVTQVLGKSWDYFLSLKANQRNLFDAVVYTFNKYEELIEKEEENSGLQRDTGSSNYDCTGPSSNNDDSQAKPDRSDNSDTENDCHDQECTGQNNNCPAWLLPYLNKLDFTEIYTEEDRSRRTIKRCRILRNPQTLLEQFGLTDKNIYKSIESIIMIEREQEMKVKGVYKTTITRRYYISSLKDITPEDSLQIRRFHWSVENNHWLIDCNLGEDLQTMKKGNAIENLALFRRFFLLLHKSDPDYSKEPLKKYIIHCQANVGEIINLFCTA